jgi:hypothetical protein
MTLQLEEVFSESSYFVVWRIGLGNGFVSS